MVGLHAGLFTGWAHRPRPGPVPASRPERIPPAVDSVITRPMQCTLIVWRRALCPVGCGWRKGWGLACALRCRAASWPPPTTGSVIDDLIPAHPALGRYRNSPAPLFWHTPSRAGIVIIHCLELGGHRVDARVVSRVSVGARLRDWAASTTVPLARAPTPAPQWLPMPAPREPWTCSTD